MPTPVPGPAVPPALVRAGLSPAGMTLRPPDRTVAVLHLDLRSNWEERFPPALSDAGGCDAIVLTGGIFFGGSQAGADPAADDALFAAITDSTVPVIAALAGAVFGLGLELALACHYRVAGATARFSLPAVKRHGSLPVNGAVERLPGLVGLTAAAELIAFGATLTAAQALEIGLIDAIAASDPVAEAVAFARAPPLRRERSVAAGARQIAGLRAQAARRTPGQAAPLAAIEALDHATRLPFARALAETRRLARTLEGSAQSEAIRYAAAVASAALPGRDAAAPIHALALTDPFPGRAELERAIARAGVAVTAEPPIRAGALRGDPPPGCDIRLHVHAPAQLVRLVEVAPATATPPAMVSAISALLRRLGIRGVLRPAGARRVLVDRLRWAMLREAIHVLDEGATPQAVDRALLGFGFAVAPFAALDHEGLPAFTAACLDDGDPEPAWLLYSPTLDLMVDAGRSGVAAGRGWYRYAPGSRTPLPDPAMDALLQEAAQAQWLRRREIPAEDIADRCLFAAINGAVALIAAGEADATAIDAVWTATLGFPRWRGGLLRFADSAGLESIVAGLRRMQARRGTAPPPCDLLLTMAARAGRFT